MISFPDIQSEILFLFELNEVKVSVLREDLIHPLISGNKFRKLKYNLKAFEEGNFDALLTFGGAYSNHIFATAAAGKEFGFKTIGVIRGEEIQFKIDENPTLKFAKECGMEFKFVSREKYRQKTNPKFLEELKNEFGKIYILPEGGTNSLAVKGCEEILGNHTKEFDCICCAVGTGGTISGIINSSEDHQKVLGFPALKDSEFLNDEIKKYSRRSNYELIDEFHFGGFAKTNDELIDFINSFKKNFGLTLDPIYTAKMMYGIIELIKRGNFKNESSILAIHTGGLQGIDAMNQRLKRKNKTEIE